VQTYDKNTRTRSCDIIQMSQIGHAKHVLDAFDYFRVLAIKGVIDVAYYCLDVRGAVLRHVLADGLRVLPIITRK
jgi:hypothetical protein